MFIPRCTYNYYISISEVLAGVIYLKKRGKFRKEHNVSLHFFPFPTHRISEKTQTPKQKNLNGKRGDKRNGKAPKGKCDSFSVKSGLASFSSAAGGINILGMRPLH